MLGVNLRDHGIGGGQGESKINIYCQPSEPAKKDGIWIQAPSVFPVNEVVLDNYAYKGGTWINESFAPSPTLQLPSGCVAIGTKIYCFYHELFYIYDTETNKWSSFYDKLTKRSGFGCVAIGTKIYLIGGNSSPGMSNSAMSTVEVYDTETNKWSTLNYIPTGRYSFGCVAVGTKIYCIGGMNTSRTTTSAIDVFDTKTNMWSTLIDGTSRIDFGCVAIGTKIYCIGGKSLEDFPEDGLVVKKLNSVMIYDTTSNTWTTGANTPDYSNYFRCVGVGNNIYYIGGEGCTKTYIYNVTSNTWKADICIPSHKFYFGCEIVKNKIYCIGGKTETNTNTQGVEVYALISKQFSEGVIVVERPHELWGKYSTQITNVSTKITGFYNKLGFVFSNAWLFKDSDLKEYPTYYGDGTKWIKFKN